MPRLLKNETDRRLCVSQRSLSLAFSMLATPKPIGYVAEESDSAIEMGLIGVAADLAISACLYEVLGTGGIIKKDTGFYLMASEALDRFRETLTSSIPRLSVLTQGVTDTAAHLKKLNNACSGFKVLFTARAVAVHAGEGTSRDVAFCAGKAVADFLVILAESSKWKPYLREVPSIPALPRERKLIAQELAAMLGTADKSKLGNALSGIFLVLPELTKNEPAWLAALERVRVTPRAHDISVLIKSLQQATVGDLFKVGKGVSAIATTIEPNDPNALPIYVAGMKKTFDTLLDSWSAYVGTANAQLGKGILSLPPIDALYMFAATGIDSIGLPPEELASGLSAHTVWPFIATALNYSGTKGPCFFLARSLSSTGFGQLAALLKKAASRSTKLDKALKGYQPLFVAVGKKQLAPVDSVIANGLAASVLAREEAREGLMKALEGRASLATGKSKAAYEALIAEVSKTDALGACISSITTGTIDMGDAKFPALRLLIDAATEREDLSALTGVIGNKTLNSASTPVRKALAEIDYAFFGPRL